MITSFNDGEEPVRVIVHGDQWPVVSATEHMVKALLPESECETTFGLTTLLQRLSCYPDALILLCLRPREHIFLFYALKDELLCHPALVISDELLFSDRVVLHSWGGEYRLFCTMSLPGLCPGFSRVKTGIWLRTGCLIFCLTRFPPWVILQFH